MNGPINYRNTANFNCNATFNFVYSSNSIVDYLTISSNFNSGRFCTASYTSSDPVMYRFSFVTMLCAMMLCALMLCAEGPEHPTFADRPKLKHPPPLAIVTLFTCKQKWESRTTAAFMHCTFIRFICMWRGVHTLSHTPGSLGDHPPRPPSVARIDSGVVVGFVDDADADDAPPSSIACTRLLELPPPL